MWKEWMSRVTREHVGVAFMAAGYVALVAGVAAAMSWPMALVIGGGLLLVAGIVIDRMS